MMKKENRVRKEKVEGEEEEEEEEEEEGVIRKCNKGGERRGNKNIFKQRILCYNKVGAITFKKVLERSKHLCCRGMLICNSW